MAIFSKSGSTTPPWNRSEVRVVDVDVAKGQITVAPAKPT